MAASKTEDTVKIIQTMLSSLFLLINFIINGVMREETNVKRAGPDIIKLTPAVLSGNISYNMFTIGNITKSCIAMMFVSKITV